MAVTTNAGPSYFPAGFATGIVVRGMPLLQMQTGNIWWVDNSGRMPTNGQRVPLVSGSDGNKGTYNAPLATIAKALTFASNGDIVMVKPGHAETIADATTLTMTVAGVAIVGLGSGSNRPTLTLSAAASNIPITAANMSIQNFLFKATHADVASVFTATSTNKPTDFEVANCEFRDGSSILNFLTVVTGNATANSMDGFRFVRNRISSLGTTAATTAIKLLSATDRLTLLDNYGNWAVLNDTACFLDGSTFQLTNVDMGRNVLQKPNTSSTGGSFVSGSGNAWTGMAYDNYLYQVDNTAGIWISTGHGTAFGYVNNLSPITGAADKSALVNPAAV